MKLKPSIMAQNRLQAVPMISVELLAYITNFLNQYFEEFSLTKPLRTLKMILKSTGTYLKAVFNEKN